MSSEEETSSQRNYDKQLTDPKKFKNLALIPTVKKRFSEKVNFKT